MFPAGRNHDTSAGIFFGSSRKVGGANKGLGEAPKSCTRKEHESATNSIAKRGQGAIAPCRVKGQRPLWGLGQRPNRSTSDQSKRTSQQRRRQRSVPASNFARPQTRPQLALSTTCTLSRQMGATDQHREKWFSCCWSFLLHGFRLCGGDQRALRSPSGLLRPQLSLLAVIAAF